MPGLDRDGNAQHVVEIRLDEIPIDGLVEQDIDVFEAIFPVGSEQLQVFPVSDPRHELDAEQMGEREDGRVLRLRIAMNGVRLNV